MRDQFEVPVSGQSRGQSADVQVRREESCGSTGQDGDFHAQAVVERPRIGDARSFFADEGGDAAVSGNEYAGLSRTSLYALGGILKHAHSVMAFCCPSTNSYKRLVPGFEAPVNLTYSSRNRSAAIRIPVYGNTPSRKRIEFRCPDGSSNGYSAVRDSDGSDRRDPKSH